MFELNKNRLEQGSNKWLVQEAKGEGYKKDIPPFTVADTDFLVPEFLVDGWKTYLENTSLGYGATTDAYYDAVIKWYQTRHNSKIEKSWITCTTGVISAISNILKAFTDVGDSVLIMSPVYHLFYIVLDNLDRKKVIHNLKVGDQQSYAIDFEKLEHQIKNEDVKVILLCSPHNPVGKVWSKDELLKISQLADQYNVLVIADEIHNDLILEGSKHTVYTELNEVSRNHVFLCTSPSKTFNLAGLKSANVVIPNEVLRDKYNASNDKLISGNVHVNTMGIIATQIVYEKGHAYLDALLSLIKDNYNYIDKYLKTKHPKIKVSPLEGTYLLWLDFRSLKIAEETLVESLNKESLYFEQGSIFGENGTGFMRMNIATTKEVIEKAMYRLSDVLSQGENLWKKLD